MSTVAFHDRDRRIIESYALSAILLAADVTGVRITDISHAEGLRSLTVRSGAGKVRFTYPIWFAGDGCPVSWQMETIGVAGAETVMTGLDVETPPERLRRLLVLASDPDTLSQVVAAARRSPAAVARILTVPA